MAKNKTGGTRGPSNKPPPKKPAASNAGVPATVPPGTAYVTRPPSTRDSHNSGLNAGIGVAYDANGQVLGFVQTWVKEGVAVQYVDGKPTGDFNYVLPDGKLGASLDPNRDGVVDPPPVAPTAPAAPPRPQFDGSVKDPAFEEAEGQRQRALASMLDSARGGEATTGLDYGFGFTRYANDVVDPNDPKRIIHRAGEVDQTSYTQPTSFTSGDTVGGYGNTDPNNPFSRASMLHKSYANANNVSSGSFANRGQLGSGAYQRAQGRNTMGYDQGRDSLLKGFAARLGEFQGQRNTAYNTNDTTAGTNSRDLFDRRLAQYNANYPSS